MSPISARFGDNPAGQFAGRAISTTSPKKVSFDAALTGGVTQMVCARLKPEPVAAVGLGVAADRQVGTYSPIPRACGRAWASRRHCSVLLLDEPTKASIQGRARPSGIGSVNIIYENALPLRKPSFLNRWLPTHRG
jgi:hypothetical protein